MRSPYQMESAPGPETTINGKRYLYFCGTSYYCLHGHPETIRAGINSWRTLGTNTATSRRNMGTSPVHLQLEKAAAGFFKEDDAAYLASGYLSNMAGLQALCELNHYDVIFVDEFVHFSLLNAVRTTGLRYRSFLHADAVALQELIDKELQSGQIPLVVSDGIFPTTGLIAPLPQYLDIVRQYGGAVWLDDAHGIGILGNKGRGTIEYHAIYNESVYYCGTLAKAFGGFGGIVLGPEAFMAKVHQGPTFIGASAPPSPIAAATLAGIQLLTENPDWRKKLTNNTLQLKNGLRDMGLNIDPSPVPIAAVKLDSETHMRKIQTALFKRGIAIQFTRYPGAGVAGMLRMVICSNHTAEQIDLLLTALGESI